MTPVGALPLLGPRIQTSASVSVVGVGGGEDGPWEESRGLGDVCGVPLKACYPGGDLICRGGREAAPVEEERRGGSGVISNFPRPRPPPPAPEVRL